MSKASWIADGDEPLPLPYNDIGPVRLVVCPDCGRTAASPPTSLSECLCGAQTVDYELERDEYHRLRVRGQVPESFDGDRELITDGGTDDVVPHVTDRPIEDLSKAALKREWSEAYEQLRGTLPDERRETVLDRRMELWNEMRDRTDAEPPECPECGGQRWSQSMGDPKHCTSCGLELGLRHEDLIEAIDAHWRKVKATDVDAEDLITDGGTDHHERWVAAGMPEPQAAERVDEGECAYEDCEAEADYRVQLDDDAGTTMLCCDDCSRENSIWVKENDLLDNEIFVTDGGTATRPGGAGECPQGCHHPVAGAETLEYHEETRERDSPRVFEVYGETVVQTEVTERYQRCIVCGWRIDL